MTTFTESARWQDWVDFCRERGPVDPDENACGVMIWSRAVGDITIAEAVGLMPARGLKGSDEIGCALWIAQHAFDAFPTALRGDLLAVLTIDPPFAAMAYRHAQGLTAAEKHFLWDAFESAMPVMRETLAAEIGEPQDG